MRRDAVVEKGMFFNAEAQRRRGIRNQSDGFDLCRVMNLDRNGAPKMGPRTMSPLRLCAIALNNFPSPSPSAVKS